METWKEKGMLSKTGDISEQLIWYECPVCKQSIKDSKTLIQHLKDIHNWNEQDANKEGVKQITNIDKKDL